MREDIQLPGELAESLHSCEGAKANCEMLISLGEVHTERCSEAGLVSTSGALTNAMAVGLVIKVWRNSPVEIMHANGRGPSDAAMFAESTRLHGEAVKALKAENRAFGLIDFEQHLLDRTRPWAGTGGRTLNELGYGNLGKYTKHVKQRTNVLMALDDHTCVSDPLQIYLVNRAMGFGRAHKGMPKWPLIVERIGVLLNEPTHPAWRGNGTDALAEMPQQTPPPRYLLEVPGNRGSWSPGRA
ncbi:hypothetical protein [Actinomadura sp. KC06]|uniref:hypothetical protein n=1 Tax=Actinomadura sp. KC06 TaxID=2530369 RepID=UPI0014048CBE|nr:hypothetical protein [Actinomadura sp. KC06]